MEYGGDGMKPEILTKTFQCSIAVYSAEYCGLPTPLGNSSELLGFYKTISKCNAHHSCKMIFV